MNHHVQDPDSSEDESNPFDISALVKRETTTTDTGPAVPADSREAAVARAQSEAGQLRVDGISGPVVFLDGKDYRVGDTVEGGKFELVKIDGLTCLIRTTDEHQITLRLRYR